MSVNHPRSSESAVSEAEGRSSAIPASGAGRLNWPRSTQREARIDQVLARRQPDLTVVLEDIHDPHNAAAVLRSCDATGILRIHAVHEHEPTTKKQLSRAASSSAAKWVPVVRHDDIAACYAALRAAGMQIVATALTDDSVDLYDVDFTRPTAVVMGNEHRGLTAGAIAGADLTVRIPMSGMVESLNISVATAVILFEAFRQRRAAGLYGERQLPDDDLARLRNEWLAK